MSLKPSKLEGLENWGRRVETKIIGELMPDWCKKLIRRLRALTPGRYFVIITVRRGGADWSVLRIGKVER
ncbi:MAG: hypothetical protein V3W44_01950 [Dehalococcoidales bacterium]